MTTSPAVQFKPGQSIHFTVTDTVLGVLTNPTTLTLTIHPPSGSNVVISNPTETTTGSFFADYAIPLNAPPGIWYYRWQATGAPPAMNGLVEDQFVVIALDF